MCEARLRGCLFLCSWRVPTRRPSWARLPLKHFLRSVRRTKVPPWVPIQGAEFDPLEIGLRQPVAVPRRPRLAHGGQGRSRELSGRRRCLREGVREGLVVLRGPLGGLLGAYPDGLGAVAARSYASRRFEALLP